MKREEGALLVGVSSPSPGWKGGAVCSSRAPASPLQNSRAALGRRRRGGGPPSSFSGAPLPSIVACRPVVVSPSWRFFRSTCQLRLFAWSQNPLCSG